MGMLPHEVAAALAAEIRKLPAGHRIPSEHMIMRRFDVSRSTVRSALRELQDQYLVRRVQGDGTFVNHRIDYVISRSRRPSLHETVGSVGGSVHTRVAGCEVRAAPGEVSDRLGVDPDALLLRLIRVSYINDAVSGYGEEWLLLDVADHIDVGLRAIPSIDQILRGRGFDPVRAWCRIGLELPDERVAEQLDLGHPTQTWIVDSLTRDRTSRRALMCSSTWTRPDMVRMVLELEEDDPRDALIPAQRAG
jgi:DNA-binding GntR family transcriptional regulator